MDSKGSLFSQLVRADLTREARSFKWLGLLVLATLPVVQGLTEIQQGVFRDRLDIVSVIQTSPLVLVLPLVVTLFTVGRLPAELSNRYASLVAVRTSPTDYVLSKLASGAVAGFVVGLLLAIPPLVIAFVIWPLVGDPGIDPSVYGMSAQEAELDSLKRFSFSEFLSFGALAYSLFYASWLGLGCAAIAIAGISCLVWVPNRFLALALPFLIYISESVVAAIVGQERAAVMFALFPFGLDNATAASTTTGLALLAGAILFSVRVVRRADVLGNLQ